MVVRTPRLCRIQVAAAAVQVLLAALGRATILVTVALEFKVHHLRLLMAVLDPAGHLALATTLAVEVAVFTKRQELLEQVVQAAAALVTAH
jgi:hypothetical protein